jgi:hypothetical protein
VNKGRLYDLCRAGTDPAVTRFLEEERSPWGAVIRAARKNIDWDMVNEIGISLTAAANSQRDPGTSDS